jgi:ribosome-associated protein
MKRSDDEEALGPDQSEVPSKSQLKREALALQALGARLLDLPPARLQRMSISDRLRAALDESRKAKGHSARRRQLRWLGKILRGENSDHLAALMAQADAKQQSDNQRFHALERWRDRLLAEGDGALPELLERYPAADRQLLRSLIRSAGKEQGSGKPPASARKLFKYLRQLDGA